MKRFYQHFFVLTFFFLAQWVESFARSSRYTLRLDESPVGNSAAPNVTSYANVLSKATPAVVGVYTAHVVRGRSGLHPMEELLRRYRGLPVPSGDSKLIPAGMGSGVIVSPEGYALTNAHVVTDQRTGKAVDEITVKLSDKRELPADIVGFDKSTDVAVLKIKASEPLPSVTIANSDKLRVGDIVFAAGNPLGVGLTVTMGIVSATGRTDLGILDEGGYENFIQTDAAINQGNSGGALLDAKGRLVGINTAIYSRSGGNIGIGFAIPANIARNVMTGLVETGGVRRGYLGVRFENEPSGGGARITEVVPGSAAARAGLRLNDIIVKASGKPVTSGAELRLAISQTPPGANVPLEVVRNSRRAVVRVTLGDLESSATPAAVLLPGVTLAPLNAELRNRHQVPASVSGLVVAESSGAKGTIKVGVVITEVNGRRVRSSEEVRSLLRPGLNRLFVWHKGKYSVLPYNVR